MKKKFWAIVAVLMAITCSGCGNRASSSTQNPPAYNGGNTNNNGNNGGNQANNNVQPDPNEYVTYGDYVIANRDEIISGARKVTYQQLARSSDGMEMECVKFTGQITQVVEDNQNGFDVYTGLIAITYHPDDYFSYYDDNVIFSIPKSFVSVRPLVDDVVTIWGISSGLESYETVLGDIRTEPSIIVAKIQFEQ